MTFVGYLEPQLVLSGYWVTPVVGFVQPGFELRARSREVDVAFEVPLLHILDEANHRSRERMLGRRQCRCTTSLMATQHLGRDRRHV